MRQLFTALFILAFIPIATAQETDLEKDTRQLLELTGAGDMGIQAMKQMITLYKQSYGGVPDEFWDEFMKEITASELTDLIVPIYMKFYDHEDIKGLIEFYNTPLGQKTVSVLPQITSESMLVGQEWGAMIGERITQRLKKKGYIE